MEETLDSPKKARKRKDKDRHRDRDKTEAVVTRKGIDSELPGKKGKRKAGELSQSDVELRTAPSETPSRTPEKKKKKKKRKEVVDQGEEGPSPPAEAGGQTLDLVVAEHREVAPIALTGDKAEHWKDDVGRTDLKYGAFTKEEDEVLKAAVAEYIKERGLGEGGVEKLLATRKHKELLGAWLEIGRCLPNRSIKRVHARAYRILHEGNYKGKWTAEEEERLRTLHSQMGPKWAQIGSMMGRLPDACKDKWKVMRVTNRKEGHWSSDENERLSRLVHESLALKSGRSAADQVKDGRQVRDDIDWTAISDRMGVRTANQCLQHWYSVLAPNMVRTGRTGPVEEWASGDDQAMLQSILESGATAEVDVEWDSLLPSRDGATCRKRWRMMVKHLPRSEDFESNLTKLCERYAPGLTGG